MDTNQKNFMSALARCVCAFAEVLILVCQSLIATFEACQRGVNRYVQVANESARLEEAESSFSHELKHET